MNEVIRELRRRREPVPVPLELPDEDLLVEIEEELYLSLPRDYREFLLHVSDVVLGGLEPATVTDPTAHTHLPDLAARAWDAGMPRHCLPVCESANGFYSIDMEGRLGHWVEGDFTDEEWETIWQWARDVWLRS